MTAPDWRRFLTFRCTGCGNCCRNTIVCITDADLRRIVAGTGKSPSAFVRFYTRDEVSMSKNDPLWIKFATRKAVMGLRGRADHCIFLENATNRCTIYEHRPVTCRDHPLDVKISPTGAVEGIALSRLVQCPHEWDGNIKRKELRAIQRLNERQEESYVIKIKEWNKKSGGPRTGPAFLRFLGF